MNANELADLIEFDAPIEGINKEAAAMLRQFDLAESIIKQQQLEIEALRNQLWDLKSEPWGFDRHPVKELTDEEIYEFTHRMIICSGQNPNAADINIFGLTRIVEDILRKAQDK